MRKSYIEDLQTINRYVNTYGIPPEGSLSRWWWWFTRGEG
jgi:hypothetical protein